MREHGAVCLHCRQEISAGDQTLICPECGSVHHSGCWDSYGHCGSYECTPSRSTTTHENSMLVTGNTPIRITGNDLDHATPLPQARPAAVASGPAISIPVGPDPQSRRWNKLAIVSLVVALVGIPLYGFITGLVALVIGAVSLIGRNSFRRRGLALAVLGIVIGIADFIGWAIYLGHDLVPFNTLTRLDDFEPDPDALNQLPATINRAMKANVLIQSSTLTQTGIGSGVILKIADGKALIVTNRHVVDPGFEGSSGNTIEELGDLMIKMIGQPATAARAVWVAPDGVDLALVSVPVVSSEVLAAIWKTIPGIKIGDAVFAIGNPHGLGWSHASGDVSQLRRQTTGATRVRVIQTSTAINAGNSGGGLYDKQGHLVGVNTWTQDKRVAEGLSFAISFQTLLELVPARFAVPRQQAPDDDHSE